MNFQLFPRQNTSGCAPYANRTQAYCDANDMFCDSGNSIQVHTSYFEKYTSAAVDFVASELGKGGKMGEVAVRNRSNLLQD